MFKQKLLIAKKILIFVISFRLCFTLENSKCSEFFRQKQYPSITRDVISLDGIWDFYQETSQSARKRFLNLLRDTPIKSMPLNSSLMYVPSSFNDMKSFTLNYTGAIWYEKTILIPKHWEFGRKIWIRFNGESSLAGVWVNGWNISGEANFKDTYDVTLEIPDSHIDFGNYNRITISLQNRLTEENTKRSRSKRFFSEEQPEKCEIDSRTTFVPQLSGIQQSIVLFTTPNLAYIKDIIIETKIKKGSICQIDCNIITGGDYSSSSMAKVLAQVTIYNQNGTDISKTAMFGPYKEEFRGTLQIHKCNLWEPINTAGKNPGYLYILKFELTSSGKENPPALDTYWQKVGIREIKWVDSAFQINNKKIYLKGLKHNVPELGAPIGLNDFITDFHLAKSVQANYLIINYPPSKEMLNLADQYGILLIVDIHWMKAKREGSNILLDFVCSNKNHPSVIAWTEADSSTNMRSIDPLRPFILKVPFDKVGRQPTTYDMVFIDQIPTAAFSSRCLQNKLLNRFKEFDRPIIMGIQGHQFSQQNKQMIFMNNQPPKSISDDEKTQLKDFRAVVGECFGNFRDHISITESGEQREPGIFNAFREPNQIFL